MNYYVRTFHVPHVKCCFAGPASTVAFFIMTGWIRPGQKVEIVKNSLFNNFALFRPFFSTVDIPNVNLDTTAITPSLGVGG